jgi:hypothetical protein
MEGKQSKNVATAKCLELLEARVPCVPAGLSINVMYTVDDRARLPLLSVSFER